MKKKGIIFISLALILIASISLPSCKDQNIGTLDTGSQNFSSNTSGSFNVSADTETDPVSGLTGSLMGPDVSDSIVSAVNSADGTSTKTSSNVSGKKTSGVSSKKTPVSSNAGGTPEKLLNGAKLTPMRTGCKKLDAKVDEIFKKIHTSGMSTYQKVKACFDYLVKNGIYERGYFVESPIEGMIYESTLDDMLVDAAYQMLSSNHGVCDDYTAAFVVMTRAIGLESYYVGGYTTNTSGVKNGHAWANVKLGGTYYIFDPQVQQKNKTPYYFFCKTDEALKRTYTYEDRSGYIKLFGEFQHYAELSVTLEVIGGGKTIHTSWKPGDGSLVQSDEWIDAEAGGFTVRVQAKGLKGKYRCVIYERLDAGYRDYIDEVISADHTFSIRLKGGEQGDSFWIKVENPDKRGGVANFYFPVFYPSVS